MLLIILILLALAFLFCNAMLKRTNWYRNNFIYTNEILLSKCMQSPDEKLDVINLGSNPARFAFFYEKVKGLNFATGSQGLNWDLAILRKYKQCLKPGSFVIIPIVLFSSISAYLNKKPMSLSAYSRFRKVLSEDELKQRRNDWKAKLYVKYPLLFIPKAVSFLVSDIQPDNRLSIVDQTMQRSELLIDAKKWMKCWADEFDIEDLEAPLEGKLMEGRRKTITLMKALIKYAKEQGFIPVIVSPPLSKELSKQFTPKMKKIYVDSFIEELHEDEVMYLDYIYDERFTDDSLFFNSLFMNIKGRKLFTADVLNKLNLI